MTAIPIHNRIIVRPDKAPEKVGEYEVAQTAQKKPQRGTVISVGPGKHADETGVLIPMQCKVGDTVMYSKFGGTEIEIDDETLVVLKEGECLAIL
jgi:chaperonin GroES